MATSPVNLLWAIQPALEEALKDEPEWQAFQQRRATFIEAGPPAAAALGSLSGWAGLAEEQWRSAAPVRSTAGVLIVRCQSSSRNPIFIVTWK